MNDYGKYNQYFLKENDIMIYNYTLSKTASLKVFNDAIEELKLYSNLN